MRNKFYGIWKTIVIFLFRSIISFTQESHSSSYTLAFDIETSGPSFNHNGILSIGASVQDQDSHEMKGFQINLSLPQNRIYEEKCLTEFWLKHPEAHQFVQSNVVSPQEGMKKFCVFLDDVEQHYKPLKLVSDNPAFDVSWLNHYLEMYTDRKSLNYDQGGQYRLIWDVHSMQKMALIFLKGDIDSQWQLPEKLGLTSRWVHDHNPLNDARTIADYYNQTVKITPKNFLKQNKVGYQPSMIRRKYSTNAHYRTPLPQSLKLCSFFMKRF